MNRRSLFFIFGVSAALQWDVFAEQTLALAGSLAGTVQGEQDVTFPVLFIMFIFSGFFFVLEIICGRHLLPYIITTGFMTGAPEQKKILQRNCPESCPA